MLEILHAQPVGWINKVIRRHPNDLVEVIRQLPELSLGSQSLGNYLLDDCRHAIAHINRKAGKRALKFDDEDESRRIWYSAKVTKELARFYIRTQLNVTDRLYLVKPRSGGFPTYLDEAAIERGRYKAVR